MTVHKKTRLTPVQREELANDYWRNHLRITEFQRKYRVSRPTVYTILERARNNDYSIHTSTNKRYRCLKYGLKRLSKVEAKLEKQLKARAKRYNKQYPGEMVHVDTKRLPFLEGESPLDPREYLFVAIDDYSRELYAVILPDKTRFSAEKFLKQVLDECPYTIECIYSDNGKEYRGNPDTYVFMLACTAAKIEQRFTKVRTPRNLYQRLFPLWEGGG